MGALRAYLVATVNVGKVMKDTWYSYAIYMTNVIGETQEYRGKFIDKETALDAGIRELYTRCRENVGTDFSKSEVRVSRFVRGFKSLLFSGKSVADIVRDTLLKEMDDSYYSPIPLETHDVVKEASSFEIGRPTDSLDAEIIDLLERKYQCVNPLLVENAVCRYKFKGSNNLSELLFGAVRCEPFTRKEYYETTTSR